MGPRDSEAIGCPVPSEAEDPTDNFAALRILTDSASAPMELPED